MTELVHRLRRRLRALFRRDELDREMQDEFRFHIEQETAHLVLTERLSLEEARRRAHISFGGVERFKESGRDARGVRPAKEFARDLRLSLRQLRRNPIFAGFSVVTLALGIGGVSAIFSVLNTVVLQPLPYQDADRLVAIRHAAPGLGLPETGLSSGTYFHYREHGTSIQQLALYSETQLNLAGDDGAQRIHITRAGPELFRLLGVKAALGRLYEEADWTGSETSQKWTIPILLGHDFWLDRFAGDSTIIGRVVSLNDNPRQIVGVLPADFAFPREETQVWHMDMLSRERASFARSFDYSAIGRLRPGATAARAETEYARLLTSIEGAFADATRARLAEVKLAPVVLPLKDVMLGDAARALWIIFGSMLLLLLVACANVANLFAVRGENRAREVAIRTALGAGRSSLARLFVAESLLVSVAGAMVGLAFSSWFVQLLIALSPVELPRLDQVRLDWSTVALAAGIAVAVTVVFGLLSLLRHVRFAHSANVVVSISGTVGSGRSRSRLLDAMVAAQVALTVALLIGCALMLRSYSRLVSVDPGFTASSVLTIDVGLPYRLAGRHRQLYDDVANRMRAIPGVTAVGGISTLPLSGGGPEHSLRAVGAVGARRHADQPVAFRFIVPGYFGTMQTRILEGIGFAPGEFTEHAHPVVISERLARRLFPDEHVIGKQIMRVDAEGNPITMWDESTGVPLPVPPYTVAGLAADTRDESLQGQGGEAIYIPIIDPRVERSIMPTEISFTLRSALPLLQLVAGARRAVVETNPHLSIARTRTMDTVVAAASARERFLAALLLVAGLVSLSLGAVGIYGIAAYTVSRRTPEIGIRVALGASPRAVMRMVLRRSLAVVLMGAVVGTGIGMIAGRLLRSMLFDVSPTDPLTFVGVAGFFVGIALVASFFPALRASRIEPTRALRAD